MSYVDIAPSILAADFGYLMRDIKKVEGHCEYLHIDVMDGHYVNNISFGIPVIQSIRKYTDMKFYTHLMITEPEKYIKALGCTAGISIHPDTPIEKVFPYIGKAEIILIMTVYPGFGGQGYLASSNERIAKLRKAIDDAGADTIISVDGGITLGNVKEVYDAGARLFVAGSTVFNAEDPAKAIEDLKRCALLS